MKRSRRLQPVARLAENHEQQAARALGDAQTQLTQAEQRLGELQSYREEYERRFQQMGSSGMGSLQMADYRQFLHNLSKAIEQQEVIVQQAMNLVVQRKQHWFAKRGNTQMLDNVVQRYESMEQREDDRKSQREQDERSSRGHHHHD